MALQMSYKVHLNIPNLLTLLRISLIPVLVVIFYLPFESRNLACAIVFMLAALTDWLDGFLARKLKQVSAFGEFLDPVADKLMVSTALVLLVEEHTSLLLTVPALIIIGREIVISALREWMAEVGKRSNIAVCWWGKIKTAVQMIAITLLLYTLPNKFHWSSWPAYLLLYLAALLTLLSMVRYLRAALAAETEQ